MIPSHHRRRSQGGSAILVILVFAAMIAIALYRELPVATFEAQRQKEELLMDRGNEYKRAVQLYVRKIQSFPPTLDALENTNRMRFLRARYVDPFTGKADWRLLHAGPGGVIIDSKIKGNGSTVAGGASGSTSSPLGAPSSVTNPFANSFNGADPTGQAGGQPANNFPQRPPTVSASGGDGQASSDPTQTAPYPGYPAPPDPSNPLNSSNSSPTGGGPGRLRLPNPAGNSYPPGMFPTQAQFGAAADPQNPMTGALGTSNPTPTNQAATPSTTSGFSFNQPTNTTGTSNPGMGAMSPSNVGSGIAGVASIAPGKTIKILNDQSDRLLWEFVYDMQKDAAANAPGLGNNNNANPNTNSQGTGGNTNSSTFGSSSGSNQNGAPGQSSTSTFSQSSSPPQN